MKKETKSKVIEELKEKLAKAKSLVLADYRGLTHQQLEEIKKALRQAQAELLVTKNTLFKIAAQGTGLPREFTEGEFLRGPTVTLFSYQDELAPLSILAKFIKNFGLPKVKIGVLNEKILSAEEILKIASLPSREVLLATLVARLKSPMSGLHYSLSWNLQKLAMILQREVNKNGRRKS